MPTHTTPRANASLKLTPSDILPRYTASRSAPRAETAAASNSRFARPNAAGSAPVGSATTAPFAPASRAQTVARAAPAAAPAARAHGSPSAQPRTYRACAASSCHTRTTRRSSA